MITHEPLPEGFKPLSSLTDPDSDTIKMIVMQLVELLASEIDGLCHLNMDAIYVKDYLGEVKIIAGDKRLFEPVPKEKLASNMFGHAAYAQV